MSIWTAIKTGGELWLRNTEGDYIALFSETATVREVELAVLAPELVEALRALVDSLLPGKAWPALDAARALLARLEGEGT